jgi:mannose-1-phosphate guanylyltransferase/mannose-6-phosphate isomerase
MIQVTAARFRGVMGGLQFLDPVIIAGAGHWALLTAQMAEIDITPSSIVLEPVARNTAATAYLAAETAKALDPDALVLLLPADHVIAKPEAFLAAIGRAVATAQDRIVTFGVMPDRPETGYGYIQQGGALADGVYAIARFREKPKREEAEALLAAGGHLWNAGIFLFAPAVAIAAFDHAPEIRTAVQAALAQARREGAVTLLPEALFAATPALPFDVAVMERTTRSAVVPCQIGWADVGSWSELWALSPKDPHGNVTMGPVALIDCVNCLVFSDGPPVAVAGLNAMIVVATKAGTVTLPMDRAQDVKPLLAKLQG